MVDEMLGKHHPQNEIIRKETTTRASILSKQINLNK